ncbi:MAG: DUF2628 domain-containing protein [Xanthobacteraceae bacterium]
MAVFSVFEPPPRAKEEGAAAPDRFVFVRDRFNWAAFIFGALWMIWHRLWLVLLGYIAVIVALEGVFRLTGASSSVRLAAELLLAVLVGLEAASLRRWTLRRRGWRERDIVIADDRESAERRFFANWSAEEASARAASPSPAAIAPAPATVPRLSAPAPSGVVGLFPQPGGSR